jgi:hypothetical protein
MQKIVDLALGASAFLLLCSCAPTAPTPSVTPSDAVPSVTPSVITSTTPSAVSPTAMPNGGNSSSPSPTAPVLSAGTPLPNTQVLAQLRLETDRRVFDAFGQTAQLRVIAQDSAGVVLPLSALALSFSSTRPTDFSVSETGRVKALKDIGFSTVRVTDTASGQFAEITLSVSSASFSSGGGGGGSSSAGNPTPATLNTPTEFEGLEEDPA